jgi:hypothetical protein
MMVANGTMHRAKGRRSLGRIRFVFCFGCALTAPFFSGCGGGNRGPERVAVSGTVTYHGKPIPDGTIRFVPLPAFPVPATSALIVDGKYKADGNGSVPVGTHKIEIEAYRKTKGASPLPAGKPLPPRYSGDSLREQYLPKRYNADSQLQITIEPGSREVTKDFDLTD